MPSPGGQVARVAHCGELLIDATCAGRTAHVLNSGIWRMYDASAVGTLHLPDALLLNQVKLTINHEFGQ